MTIITLTKQDTKNFCLDTIRVNNRKLHAGRFEAIKKTGSGKWQGKASGFDFTIFGGRAAGGSTKDWFVQWQLDGDHDPIHVGSAVEAINFINNM